VADDQHPDVVERLLERPQHVLPGGQVPAPGGDLGAQERSHRRDPAGHRIKRLGPARIDDVLQRLRHGQ
jgi:hypothetical protein